MATIETIAVSRPQQQDVERVMQMATGMGITAAMQPIVRMGVPDHLASGPVPISELARRTGSNADALYRVMRMLASVGMFAEMPGKVFALTPMSELLRSDTPASLRGFVLWVSNGFHFKVWSEMAHSIRTGQPAVEKVTGKACFDAIFADPEVGADFNSAMTCFSRMVAPALLEAYDFSGIGTLMDVAGGHGAILCEVLTAYPKLKGILFDLPNVVDEANCHICSLKLDDRCRTMHGDFFENIPAGADAYYMQHILHDWADEPALKILGNVRRALDGRADGKLIVLDQVMAEDSAPNPAKWLDLEMLLMPGGRERTDREWRELFANAGFEITQILPTKAGQSVIEARVRR
jgi:O-methyltransferase domain